MEELIHSVNPKTDDDASLASTASHLLTHGDALENLSGIPELKFPEPKQSDELKLLLIEHKDESTPIMEYMMNKLDSLTQDNQYIKKALSDISKQARKTNGKVIVMTAWHKAYGQRIVNASRLAESHERDYRKFVTGKDLIRYILTIIGSAAAGILVWIELLSKIFK